MDGVVSAVIVFDDEGDFAAVRAAEAYCRERGWSVGRMQARSPRGVICRPNIDIQKWRNLRPNDRAALDAVMVGDRQGPVEIRIDLTKESPDV
ncbi:hypothetical protein [Thalassobaculum sp.]|uniref:hypothetical protein n=1 Tax=Thalassobaculum sp. TaxID=2022740 RepID=UPI0032EE43F5